MKKKPHLFHAHENHPKPVTRRDFLAASIHGFAAYTFVPSALELLTASLGLKREALAADLSQCPATAVSDLPAFLVFDCAGGAALAGNWVPVNQGGDLLGSYDRMGMGSASTLQVESKFGAPMVKGALGISPVGVTDVVSKVLQGILTNTSSTTQDKLQMGIIAAPSLSDTGSNALSALLQIAEAGSQGSLIRSGLATNNSATGGRSTAPFLAPAFKPLQLTSYNDILNSIGYGAAFANMPKKGLEALAKASLSLSQSQSAAFSSLSQADQMATLAQCGFKKNMEFTGSPSGVDPRQDSIFQQIYGITAATAATNRAVVVSTIVMNALKGNTGPGAIVIGGCDYHNNTQATGDAKDLELGNEIGRAVEAAAQLNKPLVFQVITDGGISSVQGTRTWRGDDNGKTLAVVGYFNPSKKPVMRRTQIGHFLDGQSAAADTLVGQTPARVSAAVLANYLAISGKLSRSALARFALTDAQAQEMLLFEEKT